MRENLLYRESPQELRERQQVEMVETLRILRKRGWSFRNLERYTGIPATALRHYSTGGRCRPVWRRMVIKKMLHTPAPRTRSESVLHAMKLAADSDGVYDQGIGYLTKLSGYSNVAHILAELKMNGYIQQLDSEPTKAHRWKILVG